MEPENIDNICRICLSSDPFVSLNVKHKKLKLEYYFLLNSCASLQAEENDCLPSKVCKKCEKSLVNCYQFRKRIIDGDEKIKDMIKLKKNRGIEKLLIKNEDCEFKKEYMENKVETEKNISDNETDKTDNEHIDKPPDLEDIKVECLLVEKSNDKQTQDKKIVYKKIQCQVCGKLELKNKLKAHMRIHTGEKPYQCESCPKRFRKMEYLIVHKNIHTGERKFECETCNKKFRSYANLFNHNRTHTGEKPYMCSFCGKSFVQSGQLQAHTRTHTGEVPFKCDQCGKNFTESGSLRKHIRFFHEKERNYECTVCKKKFSRNDDVTKHMLIHTGEKPFHCEICNSSFNNKSNFRRHMNRIHLNV